MREMAFILHNIEPRSMVIGDELGRGTNTTDGLAIAIAIAEALIKSHALIGFVTHFHDLAVILAECSGIVSLHLAAEISPNTSKMTMLYRIAEGPDTNRFYGLALASIYLPAKSKALAISQKRNLILSLKVQLLQARNGKMEGDALRKWLKRLQVEFVVRIAAIDEDISASSDLADDDGQEESSSGLTGGNPSDTQGTRQDSEGSSPFPLTSSVAEWSIIEIYSDEGSESCTLLKD
ncbi:MutS protein msh4 [Aspergillus hancockii]|nr:MutS protein msh4 [Aspergillus hancockii]